MMKTKLAAGALMLAIVAAAPAFAADKATKPEAEAMVKKAMTYLKDNGSEKAFAEFSKADGQFVDRDLYVVTYNFDGDCLAHGANAKLIGKSLIDSQDADGKYFVKERVDLAKTKPNFWQEYKFTNPVTKKIEPKEMYCEHTDKEIVCAGVYK